MGFSVPLADWFRGSLREMLWDQLTHSRLESRGVVSPEFVRLLPAEHDIGRRDNSDWLWSLLTLELWFKDLEQNPRLAPEPVQFLNR